MYMKNLSNHFLVSMPQISDPIFRRTIIYICSHDNSGAMGLIINKSISEIDLNQETTLKILESNYDILKIITKETNMIDKIIDDGGDITIFLNILYKFNI